MYLELATTYRHHLTPAESVLECYPLGFHYLQLSCMHTSVDLEKLLYLKKALDLRYSLHAPFPRDLSFIVNPASTDKELIRKSKKQVFLSLNTAKKLGCREVVVHIAEKGEANSKKQSIANLISYAKEAKAKGLALCIENRTPPEGTGFSKEEVIGILRQVRKKEKSVRLCFDTGHAIAACGTRSGALDFLASVAKDIGLVHLVPGTSEGDIHTSLDIDPHFYRKTVGLLADAGYRGSLTLEVMPEIPEEVILDGAKYLRATVAEVIYDFS